MWFLLVSLQSQPKRNSPEQKPISATWNFTFILLRSKTPYTHKRKNKNSSGTFIEGARLEGSTKVLLVMLGAGWLLRGL